MTDPLKRVMRRALKRTDAVRVRKGGPLVVKTSKEASVMSMDAVVDVKPQLLRTLRPFYAASQSIPGHLRPEAQIVLQLLFSCFEKQRGVREGIVEDLVWGFEQAGTPMKLSIVGLKHLMDAGFISLRAPDNEPVSFQSSSVLRAWVTYEKPLLDMVYEGDA